MRWNGFRTLRVYGFGKKDACEVAEGSPSPLARQLI